jgi:hypothetical protein
MTNLNACKRSYNWDELEFIPNETGVVMGVGSLQPTQVKNTFSGFIHYNLQHVIFVMTYIRIVV